MRIVIEGVDRIGKTTLAKSLAKKYKLDYIHCVKDDPSDFDFYYNTLRKEDFVFDRHFIGEMIYPKIFNRTQQLNEKEFQNIVDYCEQNNIIVIVLYTDNNEMLYNRMKKEKYKEVKFQYQIINEQFEKIARNNNYIKLFNVSDKNYKKQIVRYINERHL